MDEGVVWFFGQVGLILLRRGGVVLLVHGILRGGEQLIEFHSGGIRLDYSFGRPGGLRGCEAD